jgi:hypothetical protein
MGDRQSAKPDHDSKPRCVFELWASADRTEFTLVRPESKGEISRDDSGAPHVFLTLIEGADYNAAMQRYYDFQGWGDYTPVPENATGVES